MLKFEGPDVFRWRVVSSILSNRPMVINNIRSMSETPGMTNYEVNFAKLVDGLCNGNVVSINNTGTTFSLKPGFIVGGEMEHECEGRAIGYFIEGILPLCLFAKSPCNITFTGVTNDDIDICVDLLQNVTFRLVRAFGMESGPQLKILRRGLGTTGKGKVTFSCPIVRELKPIQMLDPGFINKVRGVAYAVRVSPEFSNRIAKTIRGVYNKLLPDVYINTDHIKGKNAGESSGPGYGVSIVAISTTGCVLGTKRAAVGIKSQSSANDSEGIDDARRRCPPGVTPQTDPELIGENVAFQLLQEIEQGSCIDSSHQSLMFMLMVLSPEHVSKIRVGALSPHAVEALRLLRDAFGITFKLQIDQETNTVVCSCMGCGYKNLSRKVT